MTTIAPPTGYDWSFVGLTVHSLVMIRTFAIYVNDTVVAGAFVRGVLSSPTAEADDPWSYAHTHLLRQYGGLDVSGPEFLGVHRLNFQRPRTDLVEVRHDPRPRWAIFNIPQSGRLVLRWKDGQSQPISLLGTQDGPELARRFGERRVNIAR
jgi:hypothetical protein